MKKYIMVGLVITIALVAFGIKGPSHMDILELASIQPFIF
jgi:hypothetical protein